MNELRVRARDAFDLRAHIAIVFRIQPNQQMIRIRPSNQSPPRLFSFARHPLTWHFALLPRLPRPRRPLAVPTWLLLLTLEKLLRLPGPNYCAPTLTLRAASLLKLPANGSKARPIGTLQRVPPATEHASLPLEMQDCSKCLSRSATFVLLSYQERRYSHLTMSV